MSNSFIPQAFQNQPEPVVTNTVNRQTDKLGQLLLRISQYILIILTFLLPLVFTPTLGVPLVFTKALLALTGALLIVSFMSLAALRFKKVQTVIPLPLLLFWLVIVAAFVSAFLSGDVQDSVRGSFLEIHTASFLAIMGLMMTIPLVAQQSKAINLYALVAFTAGAGVLLTYNVIRFVFGVSLSLGTFSQTTVSPVGGLNDLAVFSAVTIVVGLISIMQLPLKRWMEAIICLLVLAALLVLAVANFFYLWVIVGFFALLLLIYVLSRDTLFASTSQSHTKLPSLLVGATLVVCIMSAIFVVAGEYAGAKMNAWTNVNYIEVRPSAEATVDMAKSVYQQDILLGSGPNRFADVWRLYKDRSINETDFWNVDFVSGYGFTPTLFVTLGLLGGILLLAFHGSYLYLAYRTLLKGDSADSFWFYLATVSFTASILLWGITYIYAPGAVLLLMTGLFTGLSFVSYQALVPKATKTIPLADNRRRGILLMGITVVAIVVSVSIVFTFGKQYTAQAQFARAVSSASSLAEFENEIQAAYTLYQDEQFLNALNRLKVSELQSMLSISSPTESDQTRFLQLAEQAIVLAQEAISRDVTSPAAYILLADIYGVLSQAQLDGAYDRAITSINEAEKYDSLNPSYHLMRAILAAQTGDLEKAKQEAGAAIELKSNYTNAHFLLTQIAVREGDVAGAIRTTEQVVTLEPNNPTRYYQLGVLYAANSQYDEAVLAYQAALERSPDYANARYMLALTYTAQGNAAAALNELYQVRNTNPDNQQLQAVIAELEGTGTLSDLNLGLEAPVAESENTENTEDGVVTSSTPDTNLVSPVNTEPANLDTNTEETPEESL